jgi:DNA-directed RNA polymerase subunit RPC12/RpoP
MAATITVVCPECAKEMKAPADFAGKKARCKACGHVFLAQPAPPAGAIARTANGKASTPTAKVSPPIAPVTTGDDDDDGDGNPYVVSTMDTSSRCPECANEMESEDAVICLHCGYNTVTRLRLSTRKVHDITGGDRVLWLLPGVACGAGFMFLVLFDVLYCVFIQPSKDSLLLEFFGSGAIKMWMCIGSMFVMFFLLKFAIKRLFLHPEPPEYER